MDSLPPRLIDHLGWTGRLDQVAFMPPGFSGAAVHRVAVRGLGEFAVKRLPAGTDPARVAEIHRSIDAIRDQGAKGLPEFHAGVQGSVIRLGSQLWEASRWQPGKPLDIDADASQIAAGAGSIGAFHRVSMTLGNQTPHQIPQSISERINRLASITTELPPPSTVSQRYLDLLGVTDLAMRNRFEATLATATTTLRQGWPAVGDELLRRLEHWTKQPVACCFVMRDIHRENALFDRGKVRFIDFDAARVDTPAIDLARWIGSFQSPSQADAKAIFTASLAEYARENPSLVIDMHHWIELIGLLQQSGAWGSLANWANWVAQGRLFDAGIEAVTERIGVVADAAAMTI